MVSQKTKAKTTGGKRSEAGRTGSLREQEERLEANHVSDMVFGSRTLPAVSLLQFKPPPQNPVAAGEAALHLS